MVSNKTLLAEQEKRTLKALAALKNGQFTVASEGAGRWRAANGDGGQYTVTQNGATWACTCPDYTKYCKSRRLRCKHIEGVRFAPWPRGPVEPCPLGLPKGPQGATGWKFHGIARPTFTTRKVFMADNTNEGASPNGWTKAYHPSGLQVTLPIPTDALITIEAAKLTLMNVSNYVGAGWLVNPPGLEDGEKEDFITRVVKRVKGNDDGTETPVVDVYPGRANFRILGIYLNTPADVQAFEKAADVKLAELPLYEGDNSIECGKGPKTDKYVIAVPKPFKVIFKMNPAYEGDEDKKHSKRLFLRWGVTAPALTEAPEAEAPAAPAARAPQAKAKTGPLTPAVADVKPAPAAMVAAPLTAAKAVVMHLPVKQDPALSGKTLGELTQSDLGQKVIRYIATTWTPNGGGDDDVILKAAAILVAASL